jgi:hypothetical protein
VSGNGALSPKDIAEMSVAALGSASSFHEFGTVHDNSGQVARIDAHIGRTAARASLIVGGRVVRLRRVNGETYFQGNAAFWKTRVRSDQRAKLVPTLRGKWVHVQPGDRNFGAFVQFASRADILNSLKDVSNGSYSDEASDLFSS